MKKSLIYIIVAAVLIGLAAWKIADNKKKQETEVKEVAKQVDKINVNVITAGRENINTDYSANGTFIPKQEMNQSADISGRVVSVFVKEGSRVGAGQVLATIKRDAIEVDVTQAQNNLQNAIADNQRYENAFKTGGVTKQQLDNSRLQLKNMQAAVRAQGVRVNDTSIRAGISGTINKKMVEPGMVVAPGTALFEIVNINSLKLSVLVDESQIGRIQIGQQVSINVNVLPEESFSGRITFIAPKSDASLNFPVEIEVQNRGNLKAGMYGTALFKTNNGAETQNMLTIPAEAFANGVSSGQIFIVQNGTAKMITVKTGKVYGDKVQIISGLNGGEQVITSGQINLDNGSKINIVK
ncbi:Toluene efflux pump periplasmic linker protein TtgD [Chryseobacterium aquaeductus]|uniref:Toluene efflux pump periplasmic linker protein TtgD n=1 Tax=Chryseobacterium aquaeductus TaxID=2675056 RepID=A0A9N8MHR6_9FLAO|nr:efflux RND transporter periplasmic adaptor subunit [Chryseobacterium aquaeductus]CAA7331999.1 Toluene efflux pump periplasmic linker protein TtgD [Chryseobacterium potabilaquae]CAD7813853.1 Toluene efflux pump periplasmic linker protein TtgD [Chryseobacterium aquaeductus]